jgi:hypothetical protein
MIHTDAKTFFKDSTVDGDVNEQIDGSLLWSKKWIGDISTIQAGDVACDVQKLIHQRGYHTGAVFSQHDFASIKFWKDGYLD